MVLSATPPPRGVIVDRDAECAQLDGLLDHVRDGASAAIVVRGEAGVGKTALVEYARRSASGFRVVRAAGVESEMELPFAALHQLCASMLDELDRLPEPQREALSTAFGLRDGPPPNRFLVGLAVLSLLSDVAEKRPLVCLVDDAQWLDRASAQVLGFAARRMTAEAVVIIFAVREPSEGNDLNGLADMTVGPLGVDHARELLAIAMPGRLDEAIRDRILAEAQGNPLALLELPRAWTPAAFNAGFGLGSATSVSERIEEGFRRRAAPLPEESRRLMLLAAADPVGDPRLVWAAADRLGIPVGGATPAREAGLLDIGTHVRFLHPMVRTVIYQDAAPSERRIVHAALAEATDPDADPDRRAWHRAQAAAGLDDEVALELEQSAERARGRGGIAAAAAFLRRAVELTKDPARRSERALVAAHLSYVAGAFDAVEHLLGAAEAYPLDGFQRARAALLRGQLAVVSGYGRDAPPLLLEAARQLEPFDDELARGAYLSAYGAAYAAAHLAPPDTFLEICRAAQKFAAGRGTPQALDLLLEGLSRMHTDGRAVAVPILQRAAVALAELPPDDVVLWGWLAGPPTHVVWDSDAATAIFERQAKIVRDAGALAELPIHLQALALDRAWTGAFQDADLLIAESNSVAAAIGSQLPPFAALRLRSLQGRELEAVGLIEATTRMAEAVGAGLAVIVARWAAAVLYNGLARYKDALAAARSVPANDVDAYPSMWVLPELIEASVRVGESGLARTAVQRLTEMTQPAGTDFGLGIEARSRALVTEGAAAEGLYREAIERLSRTHLRPELGRAQLVYGEWLRRESRRVDAREQLRAAYDLFVSIGMGAFAERARRELVATGETVRKRSVETQDQLTPQELQIARLASDGQTNAEIGAQLFLSRRTVEWHLRKVFDKLEIRSRRELATALGRQGKDHS
jgi:DNA-binding CsgD family transcriptional regulator/tetratricopeptide (TPR) repeat protein